jgi:hypothetical protein
MALEFGVFDSLDLAHGGVGELLDDRLRFAQEVERLGFARYCADRYQSDHSHGGNGSIQPDWLRSVSAYFWSDWYHVTEHHGTPLSVCPSPHLFVAALSRLTSTMRLGTLVTVPPAYEPFRLAEEIATLDQFTHGRLDFGAGSGISPWELGLLGVRSDQARGIHEETLTAVTNALRTGRMTHQGELLRDYDAALAG